MEIWTLDPSIWWNPGKVGLQLAKTIQVNLVSSHILVGFWGSCYYILGSRLCNLESLQVEIKCPSPPPILLICTRSLYAGKPN